MLAIWSRAARNPGTCGCTRCISNPSVVARRAILDMKPSCFLGAPTSTFVYTTIFAAGLAVDAKAKRKRNEQWDIAFAHLREEMDQPSMPENTIQDQSYDGIGSLEPTSAEELLPKGRDWDTVHRFAGMNLVDEDALLQSQRGMDSEHTPKDLWDLLSFDSRFPGATQLEWPANTGRELIRRYLPPQSLWSAEDSRWASLRRRQTWKKIAIQQLSVGLLIHNLLEHADISRIPEETLTSLSPHIHSVAHLDTELIRSAQRDIYVNLKLLRRLSAESSPEEKANTFALVNGPAIPQYFQDSDGDFYTICQQMNSALKNLLGGQKRVSDIDDDHVSLAIAKICHNLLVSSSAPDLQTFNILISGFKRWKRPQLVDDVIAALDHCKIRPNEITCASILDHYVQTDRPDDFSSFVARMRGADNALMLARPDVTIDEESQDRLVRMSETKVYQKVHPTPMVFNSLMLGVLKFAGFERALEIYYEMKEDGWGLDTLGLCHFLKDCIHQANWHGGLLIWEEISSIGHRAKQTHMSRAYSQMLSLCSVTGNTVAFNRVLGDVVKRGFDRSRILASATKTTRSAQKKKKKGNLAPAFAADNLLIAVSDFMNDDTMNADEDSPFEQADSPEQIADSSAITNASPAIKDPEAAWAAWLEHELGEPKPEPKPESPGTVDDPEGTSLRTQITKPGLEKG